LKKIAIDLDQLCEIFRELQRADALTTQAGVDELKTRETITNYLHMVFILYVVIFHMIPFNAIKGKGVEIKRSKKDKDVNKAID